MPDFLFRLCLFVVAGLVVAGLLGMLGEVVSVLVYGG